MSADALRSELELLRDQRDVALRSSQAALRDATRLSRLLAVLSMPADDVGALLDRVLNELSDQFLADVVAVRVPGREGRFRTLAVLGVGDDDAPWSDLEADTAPGSTAHRTGVAVVLGSAAQVAQRAPELLALGVQTGVWLPVCAGDRTLGYVAIMRCVADHFEAADVDVLRALTYRIGLALDAADRSARIERLTEMIADVSGGLEREELLQRTAQTLGEIVEADMTFVALVDDGIARFLAVSGYDGDSVACWAHPVESLAAWPAVLRGQPFLTDDITAASVAAVPGAGARATLAVGIPGPVDPSGAADPLGVLYASRRDRRPFDRADAHLASLLAGQVATSLRNAELFEHSLAAAERERDEAARLRAAQEAVRTSEQRFRALVQNADDLIVVLEQPGLEVSYASPSSRRILGVGPERLQHEQLSVEWVHPDDRDDVRATVHRARAAGGAPVALSCQVRHDEGGWRRVEGTVTDLGDDPSVRGLVLNVRDVTERELLQEQLHGKAFHDDLTGLPNRALFQQRLREALERARLRRSGLAVLFCDVDRFKSINDGLGHAAGDELLVELGRRLRSALREGDTLARLGGDEFVVLLEDLDDAAEPLAVAERILCQGRAPLRVGGRERVSSLSVGVAVAVGDETDRTSPADLLRDADTALYQAKAEGRDRWRCFDASMTVRVRDLLELESDLRRAIAGDELRVHYQPVRTTADGRLLGVEALVRWEHPERGLVPPNEFIPLAEECGLVLQLDEFVLHAATRQVAEWRRLSGEPLQLGVNLSAAQFQRPELPELVAAALAGSGLPPDALVLEMTETVLLQETGTAAASMAALRASGVSLAIDDFGTGYSSLGYLQRFPLDILKIDRSFVANLGRGVQATAIVEAIVGLATALGLGVVAEGVETGAQLTALQGLGCPIAQGYLLGRPVPAAELTPLMGAVAAAGAGGRLSV